MKTYTVFLKGGSWFEVEGSYFNADEQYITIVFTEESTVQSANVAAFPKELVVGVVETKKMARKGGEQ